MSSQARISLIVAMAENRVIGRDGGMPWHLSGDLKYFKKVTMGCPMVMGRKTYESIGRPLPGRLNIVVTRDRSYSPDGVSVVNSLDEALEAAQTRAKEDGVEDVMVVGGGQIYADTISRADRVYLTEVHAEVDGDTIFPALSDSEWREVFRDARPENVEGEPAYSFVILDRYSRLAETE